MAAPKYSSLNVAVLKSIQFFDRFQMEWLEAIANVIHVDAVNPGDYLLIQNKENSRLYFLLSGQLEVIVDEQPVAILEKRGDLFGEMSIISSQKVTASIRAKTPAEVLWLEASELSKNQQWSVHEIQHLLFRLYSQILTDKLAATNQKAKFFERTNIELQKTKSDLEVLNQELEKKVIERTRDLEQKKQKLEQQNAELMISQRKVEQMYKDRDMTFQKMEELYRNHLLPLQFSFDYLQHHTTSETQDSIKQASRQMQDVVKLLEPLNSLLLMEKAARSRRVLCAEPEKKQQMVARLALGGSGVALDIVGNMQEAKPLLDQNTYDIVFFHPDCFEIAKIASEANPIARLVLLTSEHPSSVLPKLKSLPLIPNIVSRSAEDRAFSIKNISTTVTKLAADDLFGASKYLSWGAEPQSRIVRHSSQRQALANDVETYFSGLGVRKSVRDRALMVLEELLMNVIYDAPVDAKGKSLFNHLPRSVPVELTSAQESKLEFMTDGVLMAVSLTDPFGSLTPDTILKYLESCYQGAAGSLNADKGGAGRGLHQIVENSDLVVFNLRPGVQTEVIALFNVDPKEARVDFPSFHLFIAK